MVSGRELIRTVCRIVQANGVGGEAGVIARMDWQCEDEMGTSLGRQSVAWVESNEISCIFKFTAVYSLFRVWRTASNQPARYPAS